MTPATDKDAGPDVTADAAAELARLGITRIPVDYYRFGEFRYANLDDAIAQARRQRPES